MAEIETRQREISVAILPFQNFSESEDLNYIVQGFAEDLITDLSRFGLTIISIHSTRVLTDGAQDHAVSEPEADYVVRGSFRFSGNTIRINIQLIRQADESVVFAGRHNEEFDHLMMLQDEVTQQIVNVLQQQIHTNIITNFPKKHPAKLAAYDYWLRGMHELKAGSLKKDLEARKLFHQSLAVDPEYARAHTGLSLTYFNEWTCQLWSRWEISQCGAQEYARRAVDLDENEYLALTVLGRICCYSGEYDQAEHYLRKSLRLNPNDSDNLIQVASCFVYMGLCSEAEKLYEKAIRLNPFRQSWYYATGALVYFEKGKMEKALEVGRRVSKLGTWVDFAAYMAAICYRLGRTTEMEAYWAHYLTEFAVKISRTAKADPKEAVRWFMDINPYRDQTNLTPFWTYLRDTYQLDVQVNEPPEQSRESSSVVHQNDIWTISYQSKQIIIKDVKGLHDIKTLLQEPGLSFHCTELMGTVLEGDDGIEQLDGQAKKEYQHKITELQTELAEAEVANDVERASQLNQAYETLLDHVTASLGLGGKSRKMGSTLEKTRSAVTWRIRSAIKRINIHHPELGMHLSKSIKTGIICSYDPEYPIDWEF